jgi:hypothetical protein
MSQNRVSMHSTWKVERELTVAPSRVGCSSCVHDHMVPVAVLKRVGWNG